jgi:hypothetical protein
MGIRRHYGIGWLSRKGDLRRIYNLRDQGRIDGLYTLSHLDDFARDLAEFARQKRLIL